MPAEPSMAYRGTANSRTNQRWITAEQASKLVAPSDGPVESAGLAPLALDGLSPTRLAPSKTPGGRSPSKGPAPSSQKLQEAFKEVEQMLKARPTLPSGERDKENFPAVPGEAALPCPAVPLTKVNSAPALLKTKRPPPQAAPTEYDSDDEEVKKAKCERGPKRSVALKIAARRMIDGDPPPLPMARHKVQGAHGLEYHEVVDISAIQSSCEQLGGNISVQQMLGRRRQREEKESMERLRREQEHSRWLAASAARSLSWEERQEQVMLRRQQRRQEEAYRRLASTREARKLGKGSAVEVSRASLQLLSEHALEHELSFQ